jgi:uncharacterized membrane protein
MVALILMLVAFQSSLIAQNATLNFKVSPDKATIKVIDLNDAVVQQLTLSDSTGTLSVAPGSYRVDVSRKGYVTFSESIQLHNNESRNMEIVLEKAPRGFFAKYKYWIIGGAAAVTTGAILLLNKDKDNGPGIPVPPGRPGG